MVSAALISVSCDQSKVYDNYLEIENSIWQEDSILNFKFNIPTDTSNYDLYYNLRYLHGYPFYNIYVSYYLEDSLGNPISSDLQEIILFDKKTGEPLGEGLGDIFDREVVIFEDMKFPYTGTYEFKVRQFMRKKQLPGVMSFGLKIQKASTK